MRIGRSNSTTEHKKGRPIGKLDEEVHLCSYDPEWPLLFASEAERIKTVLPPDAVIEHIGSTSVQGLLAKPIIDIMVGLQPHDSLDRVRTQLVLAGYEDLGEAGAKGRLYFRRRAEHSFNVHVTPPAGPLWTANLALRDYLQSNLETRIEYTEAKRRAIKDGCNTLLRYSDHKSTMVRRLVSLALDWKR
jgi:GrpB-like predicted nucleotidyltransferase (UPF0157 family)